MKTLQNKRIKNILLIGLIGTLYAGIVLYFGKGIPCIFHLITGFKCPGCGITHMYVDMIKFDFVAAFHDNNAVFILQPVIYYFVDKNLKSYIFDKKLNYNKLENIILYVCVVILVIFGVMRNIL